MIVATEVRSTSAVAAARSSSLTPAPAAVSAAMAPPSICQMYLRPASWSRTSPSTASCAGVSRTMPTAPESWRIQLTCSAEEVS
jgi:hypothetical protein